MTFRHRVEYVCLLAFITIVKVSPLFLAPLNARILNFLGRSLSKKHFNIVRQNLKTAFPETGEQEINDLRESIYRHFASIFCEIIYLFAGKKPESVLKPIVVNHIDILERALEKKQGVLLFSGHFGNWELVPYILSRYLHTEIVSIARPMDNPLLEQLVSRFRKQMGSHVIYKQNSIRSILKMLEENRIIYLLIDQSVIAREGVPVDFFGKKVMSVPSVSQLHLKKGKPIIPLFLHYEAERIVLDLYEEIVFDPTGDYSADVQQLTQQCTGIIEENIKKYPDQWFWFHNRWKQDPAGESSIVNRQSTIDQRGNMNEK